MATGGPDAAPLRPELATRSGDVLLRRDMPGGLAGFVRSVDWENFDEYLTRSTSGSGST